MEEASCRRIEELLDQRMESLHAWIASQPFAKGYRTRKLTRVDGDNVVISICDDGVWTQEKPLWKIIAFVVFRRGSGLVFAYGSYSRVYGDRLTGCLDMAVRDAGTMGADTQQALRFSTSLAGDLADFGTYRLGRHIPLEDELGRLAKEDGTPWYLDADDTTSQNWRIAMVG